LETINQRCEYINNRDWDEICLRESEDRYKDLVSWGVPFWEKDGKLLVFTMGNARTAYKDITMVNRKYAPTLRRKALEIGVRVIDRIMQCELLQHDGVITGAVGFNTVSGDLYVFKARAIVLATGNSSLKSEAYPTHFWTGDGDAMAYRAGAEIVGKEFSYGVASTLRRNLKASELSVTIRFKCV
jgi:succinate dehydrogenase/fumarate reductase flavoprotein subunit